MGLETKDIARFLETVHPYDSLPREELLHVAGRFQFRRVAAGDEIYSRGSQLAGLYLIMEGQVEVYDASGELISQLSPRNSFGERGLMRDGRAATTANAETDGMLLILPVDEFLG
jgi:CBS domain-containing protein